MGVDGLFGRDGFLLRSFQTAAVERGAAPNASLPHSADGSSGTTAGFFEVHIRLKLSEKLIVLPSGLVIHAENRKWADLIGSDCSLRGAIRQKNNRSDCEQRPQGSVVSV